MIPLICIEGATATGKSSLAIELAQILDTEIISADSRQVYRYLDIGTAKVTNEEQLRVKHHLVSIIDPHETYNAGQFCADAQSSIAEMNSRGLLPIVCGGTGLYIRSLLQGLCQLPVIAPDYRMRLEERLQTEGLAVLYQELELIDPEAAGKISANDPQRILRALEVYHATGIALSEHWRNQEQQSTYRAFRILLELPREELYTRIDHRINAMLEAGLINEIKELLARGYSSKDPGLNCMGYKEFIPYLASQCTLEEARDLAAQHQRNLAKRQLTWYRKYSFDLTLAARNVSLSCISEMIKDFFNWGEPCRL